jgi:hypothetical protein
MVEKVLICPLYPYGIEEAKGVLFNIVGQKELSLEEVSQISKMISEKIHKETKLSLVSLQERDIKILLRRQFLLLVAQLKFFWQSPKKLKQRKTKQPRKNQ